jgi:hypothetical protein
MAQVEKATNGKSGGDGSTGSAGPAPARRGLFGLVRQSLIDRPGQNGQQSTGAKPKRGQTFQFFFGLILFMLGSQVLLTVLSVVGGALHAEAFLQSSLAPRSQGVLLLSGLTWFELFWFALVALLYYALIKTKLLPTDPFGSKARAREQAAQRGSTRSGERRRRQDLDDDHRERAPRHPRRPARRRPGACRAGGRRGREEREAHQVGPDGRTTGRGRLGRAVGRLRRRI